MCAGEFLQAGDYHRGEAGSVHPITSSEKGCLALVMTSTQNEPAGFNSLLSPVPRRLP